MNSFNSYNQYEEVEGFGGRGGRGICGGKGRNNNNNSMMMMENPDTMPTAATAAAAAASLTTTTTVTNEQEPFQLLRLKRSYRDELIDESVGTPTTTTTTTTTPRNNNNNIVGSNNNSNSNNSVLDMFPEEDGIFDFDPSLNEDLLADFDNNEEETNSNNNNSNSSNNDNDSKVFKDKHFDEWIESLFGGNGDEDNNSNDEIPSFLKRENSNNSNSSNSGIYSSHRNNNNNNNANANSNNNNNNNSVSAYSGAMKITTSTSLANATTITYNSRLEFLIQVPHLFCEYFNSGDLSSLEQLINNVCLENCLLKTTALEQPVVGRHHVMGIYHGLLLKMPDVVIYYKGSTVNHRVIASRTYYHGTVIAVTTTDDYLYDFFSYGKAQFTTFAKESNHSRLLQQQGKQVLFECKTYHYLILNEQKTHVEKMLYMTKKANIFERKQVIL